MVGEYWKATRRDKPVLLFDAGSPWAAQLTIQDTEIQEAQAAGTRLHDDRQEEGEERPTTTPGTADGDPAKLADLLAQVWSGVRKVAVRLCTPATAARSLSTRHRCPPAQGYVVREVGVGLPAERCLFCQSCLLEGGAGARQEATPRPSWAMFNRTHSIGRLPAKAWIPRRDLPNCTTCTGCTHRLEPQSHDLVFGRWRRAHQYLGAVMPDHTLLVTAPDNSSQTLAKVRWG